MNICKAKQRLGEWIVQRKRYRVERLGCARCAAKMEEKIRALPGVEDASITFCDQSAVG